MSFAYLPLYTGDYLRDTRHLTPMRHGVFLLSLMYCWDTQGPMPLDEQEASGICNCRSVDEVEALRYILQRYFVLMDDGWYNKRMSEIVAQAETVSRARSENGLKGAIARREKARRGTREKNELALSKCQASAKQVPSKSSSLAKQLSVSPSPSPSPSPSQEKTHAAHVVASLSGSDASTPSAEGQTKSEPCPYAEIRSAWCEILPNLRQPLPADNWTPARKALVRSRWQRDLQDLDTWRDVFQTVASSKFLTGQCEGRNGGRPFQADLFWICKPENLSKLAEGAYS